MIVAYMYVLVVNRLHVLYITSGLMFSGMKCESTAVMYTCAISILVYYAKYDLIKHQ